MKNYKQLSLEQRYKMDALLKAGLKQKDIATQIGVHPSTVSREIKRNVAQRGRSCGLYIAEKAQRKTLQRHHLKAKLIKFTDKIKYQVVNKLTVDKWSPELIYNDFQSKGQQIVSHETIYKWIWACKHGNRRDEKEFKNLYQLLKHGKRRRKRGKRHDTRGIIPNRTPIEKRPKIVNKRIRAGDIEVDLMIGKNHKGAILVMTDRATLHTKLRKIKSKDSKTVAKAIISTLLKSKYKIHTLTFDNDKAFSLHQKIAEKLKVLTFFARPYTSQDKGTVENRIGVLRRFFPKKTNLIFVTSDEVRKIENKLNNRPIRKFKYKNPNQVLLQKIALIN